MIQGRPWLGKSQYDKMVQTTSCCAPKPPLVVGAEAVGVRDVEVAEAVHSIAFTQKFDLAHTRARTHTHTPIHTHRVLETRH